MKPGSNPRIKKITAKSLLRRNKKIDSWFVSRHGMNLYRGCHHNCTYCDGRAEKYRVEGEFGKDVAIKANAIDLLKKELDPSRKRTPMKPGFIMLGGGVGDSYQPCEQKHLLTRQALELIYEHNHPVHILTKSTLVERDLDLIAKINRSSKAIVSISFSSVDDRTSEIFEPGVAPATDRLQTLNRFKKSGVATAMFLMPVIPLVTDDNAHLELALEKARHVGVDFVIFAGMTLKRGRQFDYYINFLEKQYPQLAAQYRKLYRSDPWGQAAPEYYHNLNQRFYQIAKRASLPLRLPFHLFKDIIHGEDLVIVILEQMDYLLKMAGKKSLYGWAAYNISRQKGPLILDKEKLMHIKGIGATTVSIIEEILVTGRCKYYERLLYGITQ